MSIVPNVTGSQIRTSDKTGDLSRAISNAQLEMEPAKRTKIDPEFPDGDGYSDLAEVMRIAKAFFKQGISIMQPYTVTYGERRTTVSVHTRLQKDEQWMESTSDWLSVRWDPRGVAGTGTYGRRQALQSMIAGASEGADDDGHTASGNAAPSPAEDKTDVPDDFVVPPRDIEVQKRVEGALSEIRAAKSIGRVDELWNNAVETHKRCEINDPQFEVIEAARQQRTNELKQAAA